MRPAILAALLLALPTAAIAQDRPSPEMLSAALQAAVAQRDQALNEALRLAAENTLAQREVARLKREIDAGGGKGASSGRTLPSEPKPSGSPPAAPAQE